MRNLFQALSDLFSYFVTTISHLGDYLELGISSNVYLTEVLTLMPQYFVSIVAQLVLVFILLLLVDRG